MKSFGDAKWIIRPLGYKVRLRKGPFEKNDWPTDIDYAGFDVLTDRLVEMEFMGKYFKDLKEFTLEPLDNDWKTNLMDYFHELRGDYDFNCEKGVSASTLKWYLGSLREKYYKEHNPEMYEKDSKLDWYRIAPFRPDPYGPDYSKFPTTMRHGEEVTCVDWNINISYLEGDTPSHEDEREWVQKDCRKHKLGISEKTKRNCEWARRDLNR